MYAYKKDLIMNALTTQPICICGYNSVDMDVAIGKDRSSNPKFFIYLREFIVIKLLN